MEVNTLSQPQAIDITLEDAEIWRYLGGHRSRGNFAQGLAPEFAWAKRRAEELIHPVALNRFLRLERAEGSKVHLEDGLLLGEGPFARPFQGADGAYLTLVTIGKGLEEEVAQLFAAGRSIEALLLDAVGSAAAAAAFQEVRRHICQEAADMGWKVGASLRPGQHYWDLSGQRVIHQAVQGHRAGISVTEAHALVPFKSKSAATPVGVTLAEVGHPDDSRCRGCRLVHCIARIQ